MSEINCLTCNYGPNGKDSCGWPREIGDYENSYCTWGTNYWIPLQSPLSSMPHAQLSENLVDSQSDSATNSKEERR